MDCSYVTPTVQRIIYHPCVSPFMSMSIFIFSSQFLKLFVLPQLPFSSLWFPWFLSTHSIHKKVIDGSLLPTPKNYFFSSFNQLLCEFLSWPLSLCTSPVVLLFGTLRNLLISTTAWPPTNNSKNLTSSRSAQYYTCKSLSDIFWISHC